MPKSTNIWCVMCVAPSLLPGEALIFINAYKNVMTTLAIDKFDRRSIPCNSDIVHFLKIRLMVHYKIPDVTSAIVGCSLICYLHDCPHVRSSGLYQISHKLQTVRHLEHEKLRIFCQNCKPTNY